MAEGIETYRGAVFPWECDMNGHMNVRFYVAKFDEGTWQMMVYLGLEPTTYGKGGGTGFMAVQQHIDYFRELVPGDAVYVRTAMIEVGQRKVRFRHRMHNARDDQIVAEMKILGVHVDLDARKSVPMDSETLSRAEGLLVAEDAQ